MEIYLSPNFTTVQGLKYSNICNLWGKFLPAGTIYKATVTIYTRGCNVFTNQSVLYTC